MATAWRYGALTCADTSRVNTVAQPRQRVGHHTCVTVTSCYGCLPHYFDIGKVEHIAGPADYVNFGMEDVATDSRKHRSPYCTNTILTHHLLIPSYHYPKTLLVPE
jgi:hypothetical protein